MNCKKCGSIVGNSASFCAQCGESTASNIVARPVTGPAKECPACHTKVDAAKSICPNCGRRFDIGELRKTAAVTPQGKAISVGCLIVVVGLILLGLYSCGDEAPKDNPFDQRENEGKADEKIDHKGILQREIASMKETPRLKKIPASKGDIMLGAVLIGTRAKAYAEMPKLDAEGEKLKKEYKRLAVAYQVDAFPKLRKAQAAVFDALLWEQNIRVSVVGSSNSIIKLTGALFANNAAIKAAQENLGETVQILRFKEDRYEWYRGSEYTYYKHPDSLSDESFAQFGASNRWVPVTEATGQIQNSECVPELAKEIGLTCPAK